MLKKIENLANLSVNTIAQSNYTLILSCSYLYNTIEEKKL